MSIEHTPTHLESPTSQENETLDFRQSIPIQHRGSSAELLKIIWANADHITRKVGDTNQDVQDELKRRLEICKKIEDEDDKYSVGTSQGKNEQVSHDVSKYLDSIKKISSEIYFKNRNHLSDEMFMVSKGVIEHKDGTSSVFKKVPGDIGESFDAHGIDKGNQLDNLLALLDKGIDSSRTFFTAPFELPDEKIAAMGAAIGTGGGTAYKGGLAVLVSGAGKSLSHDGIKHVFINDIYGEILEPLQKAYPKYSFHLLSEQSDVLEKDFASTVNTK
jgi:hypothetical protein